MFLQAKKNKKSDETEQKNKGQEISDRLNQEIIVHNMPSKNLLGASIYSQDPNRPGLEGGQQHRKVGIFIIGGGLVLVIGIVYAAYIFILKPASQNKPAPALTVENIPAAATSSLTPPSATSAVLNLNEATSSLSTSTIVATTSTSTAEIFPEDQKIIKSAPAPVIDTDGDGLNDSEEAAFGTDSNLSDTDGDTYMDLAEILAGYNPTGLGKIEADASLAKYSVATYEILYPKTWTLKPLATDNSVIFTAPDESFIQLSGQKNIRQVNIENWYQQEFVVAEIPAAQLLKNSLGTWVLSEDNLTAYFTDAARENIYVMAYTPLDDKNPVYLNVFKFMLNSLSLKK